MTQYFTHLFLRCQMMFSQPLAEMEAVRRESQGGFIRFAIAQFWLLALLGPLFKSAASLLYGEFSPKHDIALPLLTNIALLAVAWGAGYIAMAAGNRWGIPESQAEYSGLIAAAFIPYMSLSAIHLLPFYRNYFQLAAFGYSLLLVHFAHRRIYQLHWIEESLFLFFSITVLGIVGSALLLVLKWLPLFIIG